MRIRVPVLAAVLGLTLAATNPAIASQQSPSDQEPRGPAVTAVDVGDGTQAAVRYGWGAPVAGDEFNYTGAPNPAKWSVYNSAGHAGNGLRRPAAWSGNGSVMRVTGDSAGTTGGMAALFDRRKYGRWETRMRTSARDSEYHPVLMLWPDSGNWPCDGEIDYAEGVDDTTRMHTYLHHGCANSQTRAAQVLDTTQWHNYAVEWTPTGITSWIDGVQLFSDTDTSHLPPGPMHAVMQLDWFPDGTATTPSWMEVDWTRVYDTTSTTPTPIPAPTPTPPSDDVVHLAAVGDMNPASPSTTSPSGRNAADIQAALDAGQVSAFLGLGDFQYDVGDCSSFVNYWDRAGWAGVKPKTYWISAPNHDWDPGRNEDLDNFMDGECAGDTTKSLTNQQKGFVGNGKPYSVDIGNWHFAFLSTALWRFDVAKANQVTTWLDNDLAAAKAAGKHLAVAYHDPYFTSSTSAHSRETSVKPWIDVMWKYRVRLTLSGSQHNYERSCPVNNADQCVTDGMTAFQVSTGGIGQRSFTSSPDYIVRRFSDTFGWLRLDLNPDGSFDWQFNPVSGSSTDSGSRVAP